MSNVHIVGIDPSGNMMPVKVDGSGNLQSVVAASTVTYTDRSGTIATGGAAQQIAAANASRKGFFVQNVSVGDLSISSLATAVQSQPSLKIPAGALYEFPASVGVPAGAISIIGATTGQAFTAREW